MGTIKGKQIFFILASKMCYGLNVKMSSLSRSLFCYKDYAGDFGLNEGYVDVITPEVKIEKKKSNFADLECPKCLRLWTITRVISRQYGRFWAKCGIYVLSPP